MRDKAASIWAKGFRSERVKSEPLIWARFTPQAIGFSGYRVVGNGSWPRGCPRGMKSETIFGDRPPDPPVTPLPRLQGPIAEQGINMHVPVFVPYGILEGAANDALGQAGQAHAQAQERPRRRGHGSQGDNLRRGGRQDRGRP